VIFENIFKKTARIYSYVLYDNNLGKYGALATRSHRLLFQGAPEQIVDRVIIPGDEVLKAQWLDQSHYFLAEGFETLFNIVKRVIPQRWLNKLSQRYFKSSLKMPYLIGSDDFSRPVHIAYFSIGANDINQLALGTQNEIAKKLINSDYVSVKDKNSYNNLQQLVPELEISLCPDLCILLAQVYPKGLLKDNCSLEVEKIWDFFPDGYICLQVSDYLLKEKIDSIIEQLNKIHSSAGLGLVLLPMGNAPAQHDNLALRRLQNNLTQASVILCKSSILNVASVISHSQLFIGSSLHGNISAMAYDIPNLGLKENVTHLQSYLDTWAIDELKQCLEFEQISAAAKKSLTIPIAKLEKAREGQIEKLHEQLYRLKEKLKIGHGLKVT